MLTTLSNGSDPNSFLPAPGSGLGGLAPQDRSGTTPGLGTTPDPEMVEKATRRRFTASYKRGIVAQANACTGRGEVGALLRREGLFASTLAKFRKQLREGQLDPADPRKPRVSKDATTTAHFAQQADLERENRDLRRKLAHAERIIAIQKKAAILLGETLQDITLDEYD